MKGQVLMFVFILSLLGIVIGFDKSIEWLLYPCSFITGVTAHQIGLMLDNK